MKVFLGSFTLLTLENESLPGVLEASLPSLSQWEVPETRTIIKGCTPTSMQILSGCRAAMGRKLGEAFLSP